MRRDIFYLRDHGTLMHALFIVGIAHVLRRNKWKVSTTFELPAHNGTMGPEVDIVAGRIDSKVEGNRRKSFSVSVGIEVEESYNKQTIMDKWGKYSILLDRLYVICIKPPRTGTKNPIPNVILLRPRLKGRKRIEDIMKDLGEQII